MEEPAANIFQWFGAGAFGAVIGWYTYYVNRYRTGAFSLQDIGTLIGILAGAAVLTLFPARTSLFAAYGIGLGIGFFAYFVMLNVYVLLSKRKGNGAFSWEWFLDGRRKQLAADEYIPEGTRATVTAMGAYRQRQAQIGDKSAPAIPPPANMVEEAEAKVPTPPPPPPPDYGQ